MQPASALLALLTVACTDGYGDVPPSSGGQLVWSAMLGDRYPQLFVLVVDDADRTPAAELRSWVAEQFSQIELDGVCGSPSDPAQWNPVDRRAIVVHPSSSGAPAWTSFVEDPALSWIAHEVSEIDRTGWSEAIAAALGSGPADSGASYPLLERTHDVAMLLSGQRPAVTAGEAALLSGLNETTEVFLLVATTREDESPGLPGDFRTLVDSSWWLKLALVGGDADDDCRPVPDLSAAPRVLTWAQTETPYVGAWPCAELELFPRLSSSCASRCVAREVTALADGRVPCRVLAQSADLDACPSELGWVDPLASDGSRRSRIEHGASGDRRICEVLQLEGEALASCRGDLSCEHCTPGYCQTDVPELVNEGCAAGSFPWRFRFVLGAGQARWAKAEITCNLL